MSDTTTEQFNKNIARWSLIYPDEAKSVQKIDCAVLHSIISSSKFPNLQLIANGQTILFHSETDPVKEADEWFKGLDLKNIEVLLVYGIGLGYFYDAAKDWLHADSKRVLVFIEQDLRVIRRLFETERGTAILHDRQVWIVPVEEQALTLETLISNFVLKNYLFTALPLYQKLYAKELEQLKSRYAYYLNIREGITLEYSLHGRGFFSNFFRNMFALPQAYMADKLFDQFSGVPAIICGAGPSLVKNISVLKTLSDRAVIFAGGTAMNAINAQGFLPHVGVGIDPNPAQFTRLIMNQAFETPFFYRNRFLHEALEIIQGDHLFVSGTSGYNIAEWYESQLGITGRNISEGYNVLNFSLSLASAMGCNPIILVGVDLAYTDNLSYAPGIINHPLHERKIYFRTKSSQEELISQLDIHGEPTLTLWKWVSESSWFMQFARKYPDIKVINATEGGIGCAGIPNMTLQDAAQHYLTKQQDISGKVAASIQNAQLPSTVKENRIRELTEEILESLKQSLEFCQSIENEIGDIEKSIHEGKSIPASFISKKGIEILTQLTEEPAYEYLLKTFSDSYNEKSAHDLQRLNFDESLLSEQEYNLKRVYLNLSRYKFIRKTAKVLIKLIGNTLNETADRSKALLFKMKEPSKKTPPSHPSLNGTYAFKDNLLILQDPELDLNFHETFTPDKQKGTYKEFYPNGPLKYEGYYLNEKLHGPSAYYADTGTLLSQQWFIHGLREGKGTTYYLNGALHSIERYKQGKAEGKQEYYYSDGTFKSLLEYSKGLLNGDVKLYYPSGLLKRELHFVDGKRHGKEHVWNEMGTLIIEAEFDMDKPKGIARMWRPNGNIAKEVVHEEGSEMCTIREWAETGLLIVRQENYADDFFDNISKQVGKLNQFLELMLSQVQNAAPLIEAATSKKRNKEDIAAVYRDIKEIGKGLEHLRDIQKRMAFESGLDPANKAEQIWKTPSNQREIEKEVESMSRDMSHGMSNIQNLLISTLELLAKKIPQPDTQKPKEHD